MQHSLLLLSNQRLSSLLPRNSTEKYQGQDPPKAPREQQQSSSVLGCKARIPSGNSAKRPGIPCVHLTLAMAALCIWAAHYQMASGIILNVSLHSLRIFKCSRCSVFLLHAVHWFTLLDTASPCLAKNTHSGTISGLLVIFCISFYFALHFY